jgi:hypothetical protein
MDCKILPIIKADFNSLWKCDVKGKTVAITTPFSHAFSSLINIYITERDRQFVISDGGDLYRVVASQDINWERSALQKAVAMFVHQFEIQCSKEKKDKNGVPMYYMKVSKQEEISSAVFNIAHFIMAVADFAASLIAPVLEEEEEKQNREVFERETTH